MNRLVFVFSFIMLISACGSADNFLDDMQKTDAIDSILVIPNPPNDSTKENPTDTIIVGNDTVVYPKDSVSTDSLIINGKSEIEFTKLFKLSCSSRKDPQGIAIYDKYLFHCHHSNDIIEVFNLETKKSIASISLEPDNIIHCNNVNFGPEFYSQEDKFPILYIQQRGYACKLNAYRIICNGDSIVTAKKLQTISFDSCNSCVNTIDMKNNLLYAIYEYNGKKYISSFKMPSVKVGDIGINLRNALKTYYSPYTKIGQDTAFDDKYLFVLCGYNNEGELWRIDMVNKKAKVIDLAKHGMNAEPEGIDVYKGKIVVFFPNNPLYEISLTEE